MKLVNQEVSFAQRSPNCAVYENVGYASAEGPEMIRVRFEELSDDIDTRKPGDSATLRLSNFCVHEDRRTGHIVLHMTRWDGHASGGGEAIDANVNRYEIDPW